MFLNKDLWFIDALSKKEDVAINELACCLAEQGYGLPGLD